jgi:hypothetical protein
MSLRRVFLADLLERAARGDQAAYDRIPLAEAQPLYALSEALQRAIACAENLPPSIDRRCADLIVTRLQEAEHWMLTAYGAALVSRERASRR